VTGQPPPLLSLQRLTATLPQGGDRPEAFSDITLDLLANEIVCLVGESGSGKSLTAAAVMGLLPPGVRVSSGRIVLDGTDLLQLTPSALRDIRGRRIGMIFQDPMTGLNPLLRVGEQIEEVLLVHGERSRAARRRQALEIIAAVGLPDPELTHQTHPFRLSGGQRQRVMIAIALVLRPGLLIADEPTSALDVTTQMTILRLIRVLQSERGMGVLFITHDFGVVAEIADRVAVMQHGRIVELGPVAEVLHSPRHAYTQSLIDAVGHQGEARASPDETPAKLVLQVKGLEKTYRRGRGLFRRTSLIAAVNGVDLVLSRGETLGVVGESGSGKSTLARCIVRLIDSSHGSIRLHGSEITALTREAMRPVRAAIQMVFQDPYASLNPRQRVVDIIADAPVAHGMSRVDARDRARTLLGLVGLGTAAAERFPHEFSGGQRQRIGIARALALQPELLVCDEPVSALDVSVQAQILDLLARVRRQFGLSTLFITHDLRVAARICDRVAVMQAGRIVETGPVAQIFGTPSHPYTRALIGALPGQTWLALPGQGTPAPTVPRRSQP
jgi:peptide/nickel transport system ATP-binding protein